MLFIYSYISQSNGTESEGLKNKETEERLRICTEVERISGSGVRKEEKYGESDSLGKKYYDPDPESIGTT